LLRVEVLATPDMSEGREIRGTGVVIDVLRASSSIVQALSSGCQEVIPACTEEEAREIRDRYPGAIIAGERGGMRIEGFDLGNSPLEYSPASVAGKVVVMTTSNGTKAIIGASRAGAHPVLICSFLNLRAVARACAGRAQDVTIVCSGSHGEFSLEDFACAGALAAALVDMAGSASVVLEESAREAMDLFSKHDRDPEVIFEESQHGQYLKALGFAEDLKHCAKVDLLHVVPVYDGGVITTA